MTNHRYSLVILAISLSTVLRAGEDAFAGLRRNCCYHVAHCSSTEKSDASGKASGERPHAKVPHPAKPNAASRALPEGFTAIESERLVYSIPNFFYFVYQFPPEPGKRLWLRINDHQFIERYPSGKETTFNILGRAKVEKLQGTLVIRVDRNDEEPDPADSHAFRVFIADKASETQRLYYSYPQINSGAWVYLGEMMSVE